MHQHTSSDDAGCYGPELTQETTIDAAGEALGEGYGYGYEHQKDDASGAPRVAETEESSGQTEGVGGQGGDSIGDVGVPPAPKSELAADSEPQAAAREEVGNSGGNLDQGSTSPASEWSVESLREISEVRSFSFWGGAGWEGSKACEGVHLFPTG